ncbi:endonuclease/exonuclease/phosphatase family protein [Marinimicrobium locisalis]|uniref:endonuclease/exonuclease/phosphatase family protein n=1 Tax=Marinimicrobium locisalis TaxID=546022 RepID=UPI00322206B8
MNPCTSAIRVASFNVSMEAGNYLDKDAAQPLSVAALQQRLQAGDHPQIRNIAEVIQRVRPDILLLNEFDTIEPRSAGLDLFQKNYLSRSQSGQPPIEYAYRFVAPVNTGEIMPLDSNGDGEITLPEDAYGFGHYPGQYGMAVLSRYPIDNDKVRTFQHFLWKDMPDALKPFNPDGTPYYSEAAWSQFRLSSKSHWDIPVRLNEQTLHLLASHPTPPVFDGPEDRNGKRNHDEIRFWVDYLNNAAYLYDDQGETGGLADNAPFVILGDLNASPLEGDSHRGAIRALLSHPLVNGATPTSTGGQQARPDDSRAAAHTVSWGLRADYVLPSTHWEVAGSGVFWPPENHTLHRLVRSRNASSDHRLVWVDLACAP